MCPIRKCKKYSACPEKKTFLFQPFFCIVTPVFVFNFFVSCKGLRGGSQILGDMSNIKSIHVNRKKNRFTSIERKSVELRKKGGCPVPLYWILASSDPYHNLLKICFERTREIWMRLVWPGCWSWCWQGSEPRSPAQRCLPSWGPGSSPVPPHTIWEKKV